MNKGLELFWKNVFPFENFYNFLTCFGEYPLKYREFVFGEFYKRFKDKEKKTPLRFKDIKELQEFLICGNYSTFLCGPVWFPNVSREDKYVIFPLPLLFDVDLDDYHEETSVNRPIHIPRIIRSCSCLPKTCCDTCWKEIAVEPLKYMIHFLKDIMEYKYVLTIYSGSRGFWIIVWDKPVWMYDTIARKNIADQLSNICIDKNVTISPTHLMKIPLTPHKKTGILSVPIEDPETFLPSQAIHYLDSNMNDLKKMSEKILLFFVSE